MTLRLAFPRLRDMDLHTWLDKPENKGKATALADHLGVTLAAVSLWRKSGVPLKHMQQVVAFSKGAVKLKSLLAQKLERAAG